MSDQLVAYSTTGGVAGRAATVDSEHKAKKAGFVAFERVTLVTNDQGHTIALARTGEVIVTRGLGGPVTERYAVPTGAEVFTDGWKADLAQTEMEQILTATNNKGVSVPLGAFVRQRNHVSTALSTRWPDG